MTSFLDFQQRTGAINFSSRSYVVFSGSGSYVGAGDTFTVNNNCPYPIWPATLSGNGLAVLAGGGFELGPNESTFSWAPPSRSGSFWDRTHCLFSVGNNSATCATGDCRGVPPRLRIFELTYIK
ncbi:hypothetical protein ZIOFF_042298 [Zingiber officinale]|uniref:Uncharacterized protein n=1 Tax=Zingiber officinale TaxID=94328 RepID=A0A8J5L629_ZINOF|nr:hypothetical protein ZIOFF_042298 [Zingiber officinale]